MFEMGDELKIACTVDADKATYILEGNLSLISSPYLKEELAKLDDSVVNVDIDATNLDYISDDGFDLLLVTKEALAAKGGSLRLLNPNELVAEVIEMMEIDLEVVA